MLLYLLAGAVIVLSYDPLDMLREIEPGEPLSRTEIAILTGATVLAVVLWPLLALSRAFYAARRWAEHATESPTRNPNRPSDRPPDGP